MGLPVAVRIYPTKLWVRLCGRQLLAIRELPAGNALEAIAAAIIASFLFSRIDPFCTAVSAVAKEIVTIGSGNLIAPFLQLLGSQWPEGSSHRSVTCECMATAR
jgi:hypothetical protein